MAHKAVFRPERKYLEAFCDCAHNLAWHLQQYWSIDGKPLSEPNIGIFANGGGIQRALQVYDAVKLQRNGTYPGPVVEWQLASIVFEWHKQRASTLAFRPDVFFLSRNVPAQLVERTVIPSDLWQGWGEHVPRALQALVIAMAPIVGPLKHGEIPDTFVGREIDAILDSVSRLREAVAFIPTEIQEAILEELKGVSATGEQLLAGLNCGSKETLYGKNGRGGLSELVTLGLVKNDRRLGGYYRPDAPPIKRTEGVP